MVELFNDKIKSLVREPGNNKCMDCNVSNPQWATVTFGVFICLDCASVHRSMGVNTSFVKSVTMDSWTQKEYLFMKFGSNSAFKAFITQHGLLDKDTLEIYVNSTSKKYANKLKEKVFTELGITESEYETSRASMNTHRANSHRNNPNSKSNNTFREVTTQNKFYDTLSVVSSSFIGCMKEIKNKTFEYGGKLGKHVIVPTTNMLRTQKDNLSAIVFKQEKSPEIIEKKKVILFEDYEQEDLRKWD
ncbi:hypothetical protein NGRA_0819 [Nosema granulosis]|uniref:Arf-GAP domain-containing protein n=1 Tax=Nosema granulosis TaxID=83296 RepID=A0A9P6H0N5_9MICR|nr:hypothetical protein NGRA_0819 [Nosema granulosis]